MEQLSVAIADDNQKILNVLGEIVSADKTDSRMLFFSI